MHARVHAFAVTLAVTAVAAPAHTADVAVAVLPPGCADPWQRVLLLAGALAEPLNRRGGGLAVQASGPAAVAGAGIVALPVDAAAGPLPTLPASWQADGDVEILETPFERIVVLQPLPGVDLLGELVALAERSGGRFPDVVRRRVPRLRAPGVVGLQVGRAGDADVSAAHREVGATTREVVARFAVHAGDQHGVVVAVSRSLGGPARLQRAMVARPADLVLYAGGVRDDTCAATLTALGVQAAVPRTADLARATMATTPKTAPGPFLAANVTDVQGGRLWPRHRVFVVQGLRVAVIGLVGAGEWQRAPEHTRARLRVGSGRDAVADVVAALRRDPAGPPDLIVALSSGDGAERAQLSAVDGLDLIVADFARDDGLAVDVEVVPRSPRERVRHDAVLAPVLHRAGLGHVVATFDEAAAAPGAPRALLRLRALVDPLLDDGAASSASASVAAAPRRAEDALALQGAAVVLPPVATLAALPAAAPLVWGERVALLGEERRRGAGEAAVWTDDLWLRVVGNAAARGAGVDVALVRNMRRMPLVAGPLSRATVAGWLADTEGAIVVDIGGADLLRLAERLAAAPPPLDDASGLLAAAGLDAGKRLVAGRPIEPLAGYRLLIDERVLADPRVAGLVDPLRAALRTPLAALVLAALAAPDDAVSDDVAVRGASLVVDRATIRVPEWRLGVPALELRGTSVRTSPGLIALADSLETRALQRELVAVSAKLLAFATYDTPGLAWDNQLRVQYDVTFFADATRGPPLIEPFDDVVATTELRRDVVRFDALPDAPGLTAFIHVTADGELTPVPDRRRQAQLRQAAGLVWAAGGVVREVRLGAVAQQDLAQPLAGGDGVYNDLGALGLLRFALPLGGPLSLESTSDARFFFADADDRPFDLALRAQSVTRIQTSLSASTNGFVFVDVVALSPKPQPDRIEWNVVTGLGVNFGGVLRH
ncbi:MAG: hypothetical protein FJ137_21375 [Deltaproteobacteria bacterium]|nr:hypothetical protein [Deltaproteobacteria bacterium]